jgi:hypothetical protein
MQDVTELNAKTRRGAKAREASGDPASSFFDLHPHFSSSRFFANLHVFAF